MMYGLDILIGVWMAWGAVVGFIVFCMLNDKDRRR